MLKVIPKVGVFHFLWFFGGDKLSLSPSLLFRLCVSVIWQIVQRRRSCVLRFFVPFSFFISKFRIAAKKILEGSENTQTWRSFHGSFLSHGIHFFVHIFRCISCLSPLLLFTHTFLLYIQKHVAFFHPKNLNVVIAPLCYSSPHLVYPIIFCWLGKCSMRNHHNNKTSILSKQQQQSTEWKKHWNWCKIGLNWWPSSWSISHYKHRPNQWRRQQRMRQRRK